MKVAMVLAFAMLFLVACTTQPILTEENNLETKPTEKMKSNESNTKSENLKEATFAGGCFWCMESAFELKNISAISGFTGGKEEDPDYYDVVTGGTGHVEAVRVHFDPKKVTYEELLKIFWRNIDPTDAGGQFADRGASYTTAIFYHDEEQKKLAEQSKKELEESGKFNQPIVTKILPVSEFYEASEEHQDYHTKNPLRYNLYKRGSGREGYIENTWGSTKEDTVEE